MRPDFLPFSPPFLGEEEIDEVVAALRSGWISRGPRTALFEKQFAEYVGAEEALALNSCTAGLHLALVTLGIGAGDEVIVPTLTFAASANVVEHVGAKPVLADVEQDTLNLDPVVAESLISERTKALMVVHYGGHPADMDRLQRLADRWGIPIIEDAAHALPARYHGRTIGSSSNLTSFSFYATKNLTTGEGGMLTGPPELLAQARVLSLHGMSGDAWNRYSEGGAWSYEVVAPGYKYNMGDVQAALGLRQLEKLGLMQERRLAAVQQYQQELEGLASVELPSLRPDVESAWHLYPIRLNTEGCPVDRESFVAALHRRNIGTSVHFIPLHRHRYYRDRYGGAPTDFPVAESAFERLVSLPLHPGLSRGDVSDVVGAVRAVCGG
jgi:dTDP-4-amino-4,6-dideoxygalactose transaminase